MQQLTSLDREVILSPRIYHKAKARLQREPLSEDLVEEYLAEREVIANDTREYLRRVKIK